MVQAETRPGFVACCVFYSVSHRDEFRSHDPDAAAGDAFVGNAHGMDDSKMDVSNFGAVIIDLCNGGFFHFIDCHFLHYFTPHTLMVATAG